MVGLKSDPGDRSLSQIRVFTGTSPEIADLLIADITVDPEYTTAYGATEITVSIDVTVNAQYFRVEFTEFDDTKGVRVLEIDGFSE